ALSDEYADRPAEQTPSLCGWPCLALDAWPRTTPPARMQITKRTKGSNQNSSRLKPGYSTPRLLRRSFSRPQTESPLGCRSVMNRLFGELYNSWRVLSNPARPTSGVEEDEIRFR